jgi:long-subunit acyl-CoA synthetase (AMP-forming)
MFTVGKPRFGAEVKLVDDNGREVGVGNVGEILGKGPACASGYYKDSKATSDAWNKDGWFGYHFHQHQGMPY